MDNLPPEPIKGLGSPKDNYVRTADVIELKPLHVDHICLKHVIG